MVQRKHQVVRKKRQEISVLCHETKMSAIPKRFRFGLPSAWLSSALLTDGRVTAAADAADADAATSVTSVATKSVAANEKPMQHQL